MLQPGQQEGNFVSKKKKEKQNKISKNWDNYERSNKLIMEILKWDER